jgi:hypothetical protein
MHGGTPIRRFRPQLLLGMTIEGQSARWRNAIAMAAREAVYVAESEKRAILGMTSLGRTRSRTLL